MSKIVRTLLVRNDSVIACTRTVLGECKLFSVHIGHEKVRLSKYQPTKMRTFETSTETEL